MKILSVAFPLLPVGPGSAGGAEQILYLLDRRFVQAGHRSIVIAAEGSQIGGELVPTPVSTGEITERVRVSAQHIHLQRIEEVIARESPCIIHFHGLDFHAYFPSAAVPRLATLHLPPSWYSPDVFRIPDLHLSFVSKIQANAAGLKRAFIVENGVDLQRYSPSLSPGDFLLWIGRICPEKGTHIAINIARSLDLPIVVAGPVHPFHDHRAYFAQSVEPLLDDKRRYIGAVDLDAKVDLLSRARCLLIPSLVAETSSLVAMEAAASGTAVIAFRSGALPEVIQHEVTGFIVDSEEEMAGAVLRAPEISRTVCRATAEMRFDADRMADDYLRLYASIRA